jgi:hypothetical protein
MGSGKYVGIGIVAVAAVGILAYSMLTPNTAFKLPTSELPSKVVDENNAPKTVAPSSSSTPNDKEYTISGTQTTSTKLPEQDLIKTKVTLPAHSQKNIDFDHWSHGIVYIVGEMRQLDKQAGYLDVSGSCDASFKDRKLEIGADGRGYYKDIIITKSVRVGDWLYVGPDGAELVDNWNRDMKFGQHAWYTDPNYAGLDSINGCEKFTIGINNKFDTPHEMTIDLSISQNQVTVTQLSGQ